jgi:hypothetical protein
MLQQLETPFKVLSMESRNGMVLIVRMKIVFDAVTMKPKEKVIEVLTRKLVSLRDVAEMPME